MAKWTHVGTMLVLLCLFGAMGCAHGLKQDAKAMVDFEGTSLEVQQSPDEFIGRVVEWGGRIIETRVEADATEILVLQYPLGYDDRPSPSDEYRGRFVIRSAEFLDPALLEKEKLVSVVGELTEVVPALIGEKKVLYPVLRPLDLKVWEPVKDNEPRIHFGIGIGTWL